MKIFDLSTNVIDKVVSELQEAEKYIRIAIFQLHNQKVFDVLNEKLREGVNVEIFTLPYDSIHEDIKDEVAALFKNLQENGANLYFCKWNVGDPERTTTAVGRWYSFHGKIIVTDKSAIALSANFIQNEELDALLIFKNETDKIEEYNSKFDELISLYVKEQAGYNGSIRQKIIDTNLTDILSVFELPRIIETEIHTNHWIQHYPSSLCPESVPIEDRLYFTPFDCRGRNLIMDLIEQASQFVYLSAESFTDPEFSKFLERMKLRNLDIQILCGAKSQDFSDRIQVMFRDLLAADIKIKTTEEDIHAKLIITDKHLAVTSVNLNKINLGFKKTNKYWRENTESISICADSEIISIAKNQYLNIFGESIDIEKILAKKIENLIGSMFTSTFDLRSTREVKELLAYLVLRKEIEVKKFILNIGNITAKLMRYLGGNTVDKDTLLLALVLYYLSERKHDFDQLHEKLSILDARINLNTLLATLLTHNFIEKEDDFYKIKVDTLF